MKVVIADDEKPLLSFLQRGLQAEGYDCVAELQLHNVLTVVRQHQPVVVVLDRMFGQEDSIDLLDSIKKLPNSPMVLLLTAMDEVNQRVEGLTRGADDYLCKPFDFDELLARVHALARRGDKESGSHERALCCGDLRLEVDAREVRCGELEIILTRLEFDVLHYLMDHNGKVLSRERILNRAWNTNSDPQTNIVDVYISRLRQKIPDEAGVEIQTLRGNGYRLRTTG